MFTVSSQRWCKLRGNLLFYFKTSDQFSEPAGVIVLEKYRVTVPNEAGSSSGAAESFEGFPFYIGNVTHLMKSSERIAINIIRRV
jgi:hypothetical protein